MIYIHYIYKSQKYYYDYHCQTIAIIHVTVHHFCNNEIAISSKYLCGNISLIVIFKREMFVREIYCVFANAVSDAQGIFRIVILYFLFWIRISFDKLEFVSFVVTKDCQTKKITSSKISIQNSLAFVVSSGDTQQDSSVRQ